jgi:ParB/RepB/Spo0J family partition protein
VTEIEEISIDLLRVSADETRKTFDPIAIAQLAESIKLLGIQEPLIVRPADVTGELGEAPDDDYEVVSGQRRLAAARLAGLQTVPCIVRLLNKEDAQVSRVVSNLQREDVSALEEADGYEALRQQLGSVEAIAASVSKPIEYVTRRLKLVSLGLIQRDALRERLITIDHALLLSKLGVDEQNAALKWTLDKNAGSKTPLQKVYDECVARKDQKKANGYNGWSWEPQSFVKLKAHIEETSGRRLALAPWSLEDAELLPARGACADCPSNTKSNLALFGDLDIENATCADGACFEEKRDAYVRIRLRTATNDDIPPLRLSFKRSSMKPRWEKDGSGPVRTQVFKMGQWIAAKKKSCEYVETGISIDWQEVPSYSKLKARKPGELIYVCVAGKCKEHKKDWENGLLCVAPSPKDSKEDAVVREEKIKAFMETEPKIRRALYEAIKAKITPSMLLRDWILDDGNNYCDFEGMTEEVAVEAFGLVASEKESYGWWKKDARQRLEAATEKELLELLFPCFYFRLLEVEEYNASQSHLGRRELLDLAKRVGVDAAAIIKSFEVLPAAKLTSSKEIEIKQTAPKAAKKSLKKPTKKVAAKKAAKR